MKRVIAIVLAAALCLSLCACSLGGKIEGSGYKSPEDAILAYAKALKGGNVSKILSTFAIETFVENYDLEAYIEHTHTYQYSSSSYNITSEDAFTTDLNMLQRQQTIAKKLADLCVYYSLGEDSEIYGGIISFAGDPYADPDDLLDDLDAGSWKKILSEMDYDDDFVYVDDMADKDQMEQIEDILDRQCDYYGCDEIVPIGLEVELDGEDCVLFMNVACYDGKWYNLQQGGVLSSLIGCPPYCGGLYIEE